MLDPFFEGTEAPAEEHLTSLEDVTDDHGNGGHEAACTCGWKSGIFRRSAGSANDDAVDHELEMD